MMAQDLLQVLVALGDEHGMVTLIALKDLDLHVIARDFDFLDRSTTQHGQSICYCSRRKTVFNYSLIVV